MNIPKIENLIPQRYPFLLIDKILEYNPLKNLIAIKNTTLDEWPADYQSGFLLNYPEVLIIEGAAQSAAAFFHLEFFAEGKIKTIFLGKVTAEFFEPIKFGNQIIYKIVNFKVLKNGGFIDILAESESVKAAEVRIFCSF